VLLAGTAASSAYVLEMALDMWLTGNRYDDFVLWGGLVARDPFRQRMLGVLGHYSMGTGLAAVYQALHPSLPEMPGWAQGLLFIGVEHALTFPTVALGNPLHPSVRKGELPSLATWQYFWVETARHAAYGVVLGIASD
jgi:hypothetical protein